MKKISPLQYPGGKTSLLPFIIHNIPTGFNEYREPFCGGASVFLYLKKRYSNKKYWINDLDSGVYCFWLYVKNDLDNLIKKILDIYYFLKSKDIDYVKKWCKENKNLSNKSDFDKAVYFFVLNRSLYGGCNLSSFSEVCYNNKFTFKHILFLKSLKFVGEGDVKITNYDYSVLLKETTPDTFIYLDPPYYKEGDFLYKTFDLSHENLYLNLKNVKSNWLLSYSYYKCVLDLYKDFYIYEFKKRSMFVIRNNKCDKIYKEMLISNYSLYQDIMFFK